MRLDSSLAFVPLNYPLSLVGGSGVSIPSTNIIDMLGLGVGVAPQSIIGNATVYGQDEGVGGLRPELNVVIGTTCTTGTSATLNVAFQAAIDLGSGGSYQPGTWTTVVESGPMAASVLTAGSVIFRTPYLPTFPPGLRPRFLRLLFQLTSGTSFTAGTIASAVPVFVRDDQANRYAPRNYSVA